MSDADIRELGRNATVDISVLPRYLQALNRAGQLISGNDARQLVFRVRINTKMKRLRKHPWARWENVERSGTWWAIGNRPGDDGRVYLQPATDTGFRYWNKNVSFAFATSAELIDWMAPLVVEWREVQSPKEPPRIKTKRKRRSLDERARTLIEDLRSIYEEQ